MIRVLPRAALGLVVPAVALVALAAHAKGQLSAGSAVEDVAVDNTGQRQQHHITRNLRETNFNCATTTISECRDPDFAASTCGRLVGEKIREGITNICTQQCGAPTPGECSLDTFHRSLCGMVDAMRRLEAGPHVDIAGITDGNCDAAPGSCGELLCEKLAVDQFADGDLVSIFLSGLTVLPTFADADTGSTTGDVLSLEQNGYADPGNLVTKPRLKGDMRSFTATGGGNHYWSRMIRDQSRFIQRYPTGALLPAELVLARDFFTERRDFYNSNDNFFNDCDEYVYEKYYDYSLFEDATRLPNVTHREVFDIAYADINGDDEPRSAIATRFLEGIGFEMREGAPLDVAIKFEEDKPQNIFFSFDMPSASDRQNAIDAWNNSGGQYVIEAGGVSVTVNTDRPIFQKVTSDADNRLSISAFPWAPAEGSETLFQALQQRRVHDESFGWHGFANERLSEFPDEVLYIYDRLKDEFDVLLKRRAAILFELHSLLPPPERVDDLLIDNIPWDNGIQARVRDPSDELFSPMDSVIFEQRFLREEADIQQGMTVSVERMIGVGTIAGQNLLGSPPGMQTRSAQTSGGLVIKNNKLASSLGNARDFAGKQNGGSGLFGSGLGTPPPEVVNTDPLAAGMARGLKDLAAVDAEIEVALLYARSVGCVTPVPANDVGAIGPCDWSPRDFAEAIDDQLLLEREFDHQRCIEITADDFDSVRLTNNVSGRFDASIDPAFDVEPYPFFENLLCDDPAYNDSVLRFERYKGCVDAWRVLVQTNVKAAIAGLQALLGNAKDIIDPTSGQVRPNQHTSSGDDIGDDTFGAGYDYTAGWAMTLPPQGTPDNQRFCALAPNVYATFDVRARIFGGEAEIVDAGLEAGLAAGATNRASLEIVGVSLIDIARDSDVDRARFNVIYSASKSDFDEYFSASATFMVGPVPVTVSAGAGGTISATVEARGGDLPNGQGCSQGDLALQGAFIPSYSLIGFASAGIDVLVVEAGVKIDLLLAAVSFPYTVTLNVEGGLNTAGRADAMLKLNNDLDIVLSFLGGRVAAYVEVCFIACEEWDFTIFQWAPLKISKSIFHETIEFSLEGVFRLNDALDGLTFPGGQ